MNNNDDYALLTDLYQITMAQGYWACGKLEEEGCFHIFFREPPFKGGYAIASGMDHIAEVVENFSFSDESVEYLASIDAPGGGKLFNPDFLEYLRTLELTVEIDAVREGTVVFPNDPIVRVTGPIVQCQLLETQLLNCVNFETLAATKAARVCLAAETPVAEFGLRRAQGESGGMRASRACIVGGCASTSNVLAGREYGLPVSGTHAHAWVMAFDDELEAFRAYAKEFPTNCVLLVDTYDVAQGMKNAITVGLEMKARGEHLAGIRIDSGDLAWNAKQARAMLDEAGLVDTGVVLSNDLDEFAIKSIRDSGAKVASWGVGTKLVTAYDQPALGGVYKLAAKRMKGGEWEPCVKVTGQSSKQTVPGILDVRRYFHESGTIAGDMVFDVLYPVSSERIIDPADELRQKDLSGLRYETLLEPGLPRAGKVVLECQRRATLWLHEIAVGNSLLCSMRARSALSTHTRIQSVWNTLCSIAGAIWSRVFWGFHRIPSTLDLFRPAGCLLLGRSGNSQQMLSLAVVRRLRFGAPPLRKELCRMIKVVTDSVASLPKELIEEENIEVVSLFLNEDGHEHVDATMDLDDFYTRIYDMADNPPTSSQPSQSTLEELFESFAKAGHEVLGIWISTGLSGAFDGVLRAARSVESRNINFKYCMIDSSSCGFDEAFPVLEGARAVREGKTLAEAAQTVLEAIKSTRFLFTPESLTFLKKGGRIGGAAALLGNLIKLAPVLTVVDGTPGAYGESPNPQEGPCQDPGNLRARY